MLLKLIKYIAVFCLIVWGIYHFLPFSRPYIDGFMDECKSEMFRFMGV